MQNTEPRGVASDSSAGFGGSDFPVAPTRRRNAPGRSSAQVTFGKDLSPSDFAEDNFLNDKQSGTEPEGEPLLDGNDQPFKDEPSKFGPRRRSRPVVVPGGLPSSSAGIVVSTFRSITHWFGHLEASYGGRLLLLLHTAQHLLKGVVQQFQASTIMWVFMEYRISGPQLQIYTSIASSAWAFKPVIGMISDMFPIWGYRKAPYVIITSIIGVVCTSTIGFSTQETSSIVFIVMCFWGMSLQAATCDLLSEAKYSEHLQDDPTHGPDLITYVWGGINIGNLIAISVVGSLIATLGPRAVFLTCIIPSAAILYPAFANFFEETPMSSAEVKEATRKYLEQGELVALCGMMTVMTIFLSLIGGLTYSQKVHFYAAMGVIAVVLPAFYVVLRPEVAKVNTFFVLQSALSLNIGGATFYFYTDSPEQFPDGPHFTPTFFATTLGFVACVMSLVGLATYTKYMKEWNYRSLAFFSNILVTLLSLLDVIMFLRLNIKWGIPDEYFVMGSSVATVVIRQWQWMPGVVIMSQLCPKGMEATMFALLAGCSNVGSQVSDYMGAYLLSKLHVHPAGNPNEQAQFENLWQASLISTLLPAITIVLIPVFIPNAKQTERLLVNDTTSATAGSLWSRWQAWRVERNSV